MNKAFWRDNWDTVLIVVFAGLILFLVSIMTVATVERARMCKQMAAEGYEMVRVNNTVWVKDGVVYATKCGQLYPINRVEK